MGRTPGRGRGVLAGFVLAGTTLVVIALGSAPSAEAQEPRFGFSDGPPNIAAGAGLIARARGDIARVPFSWGLIEPRAGEFRFGPVDAAYQSILAEGLTPLFVVFGAAAWAQNRYAPGVQDLDDHRAWRRLWRALARRYPGAIWQVWNEPNHPIYGSLRPGRAANLTRAAARAIHSVAPQARVVGPAVAPIDGWRPYMRSLYRRLGGGIGVAVNIYPRNPLRWRADLRASLRFANRVAGRQRLWITETGLSRVTYGRRRQARGSAWIYRRAARSDAAAVIFHRLSRGPSTTAWDRGLAVTKDFRPLPVFRALRAARSRHGARGSRGAD